MSTRAISTTERRPVTTRAFYAVILAVFVLSGMASLVYQVVWQRSLTLYYGVGPVSTAIVVSVFLAGLGIGALLGGWIAERSRHLLTLYLGIEVGIGIFALLSLDLFQIVFPQLTSMSLGGGLFLIAAALTVPTILMGATLPIVLKVLNRVGRNAGHSLSLLYFANTIGAAVGSLAASYGLISFLGLAGAVYTAAFVNFALAALVLLAIWLRPRGDELSDDAASPLSKFDGIGFSRLWVTYVAVFATGFLAIGYQLVWFRIIGTLLKPSAYVFSTVLAVYLLGIALGSLALSRKISSNKSAGWHRQTFFKLNAGISLVTILTFVLLSGDIGITPIKWMLETSFEAPLHPPFHPVYALQGETPGEFWRSVYVAFDLFLWPLLITLPATLLMGASFPLITAMAIEADPREGFKAGSVYALNIVGNVAGALVTGFLLFPLIGTELVLLVFSLVGLLWLLGVSNIALRQVPMAGRVAAIGFFAVVAMLLMPKRAEFYASMHPEIDGYPQKLVTEDVDGVVVSYRGPDERPNQSIIYISGSDHATYPHAAYQTEALETITYASAVKDVLVIGFGGGDLTDTLLKVPGVEHITVVEISDALVNNLRQIPFYAKILNDERVELIVEDGRRFLQTNAKTYDIVVMDPLRATAAYSNNIYSKEFFEIVRSRLNPQGVLMTWMNEYLVTPRTLGAVFAHMRCYYFFCLSSQSPMAENLQRRSELWALIDPDMRTRIEERLNQPYYFKGDRAAIAELTRGYPINTDLEPVTEYYFGYNLKRYFRLFRGSSDGY